MIDPQRFRNGHLGWTRSLRVIIENEVSAFWENKNLLLSMFLQPFLYVAFLVAGFGALAGSVRYEGVVIPYESYAMCGVLSLIMVSQMSQATYRSTVDKQYGLLAIKITNGVTPLEYILGMSTFPVLGYLAQGLLLWSLGWLTGATRSIPYFGWTIVAGIPVLIFWSTIGIMVSTLLKNYQQRDLFMQLVFTPLSFTSPAFYVLDKAPRYVQVVAWFNPMTYQLRFLRSVAFGKFDFGVFGITIGLTVFCVAVGLVLLGRMHLTLQER